MPRWPAGLVVGEKTALGPDLLDDFRTVGLIHIVILSGYSVGIVIVAVRRMLSFFLPRVWSISIAAAVLFFILLDGRSWSHGGPRLLHGFP